MPLLTTRPIQCPRCGSKHVTATTYALLVTDTDGRQLDPGGFYHCSKCSLTWERPGPMGAVRGIGS